MTHDEALNLARREMRALAIAAATELGRDRLHGVTRGRGQHADTLDVFDMLAERLAAPGLAAIEVARRTHQSPAR